MIVCLVLIGDVKIIWFFSVFNVLIYYVIINFVVFYFFLEERFYFKWLGWLGLVFCLFLVFWVEK